jgi:Fur family transcriptional regulator, ferric uptake regulator
MSLKDRIRDELLGMNMRATAPRVAILEIFREEQERMTTEAADKDVRPAVPHFSADEMFRRLVERNVDVGVATVYRVMQQFEEAGLLTSSHFDTERVTYELNDGHPHDHMVCIMCGRVDEFHDTPMIGRHKVVANQLGYLLQRHALALYGICPVCQAKMKESAKADESGSKTSKAAKTAKTASTPRR